jgi:NADH:ubiquinone reductase (H+-translocating)
MPPQAARPRYPAASGESTGLRTALLIDRAASCAANAAWLPIEGAHASVMSCQHARPMGRFDGYNVLGDLLRKPMLRSRSTGTSPASISAPSARSKTEGFDRAVTASGAEAKDQGDDQPKAHLSARSRDRREIFDAAAPVVQIPPKGVAH